MVDNQGFEQVAELQTTGCVFEEIDNGGDTRSEDGLRVDGTGSDARDEHFSGAAFEGFDAAAIKAS